MQKQFWIMSRISNEVVRRAQGKSDRWEHPITFFSEPSARAEFGWLKAHAGNKEYILIRSEKIEDNLNDSLQGL